MILKQLKKWMLIAKIYVGRSYKVQETHLFGRFSHIQFYTIFVNKN
jgi:hypothetical protein